ncbi:MAG: hypothetical protein DCC57_18745 [Chloroflexi bacterium]|nr:MAG: hypothetical protein DCC57_18745 [Chloroflexota bacterium]
MNPIAFTRQRLGRLRQSWRIRQQRRRNQAALEQMRATGQPYFAAELRALLGCDDPWLAAAAQEYAACPAAWEHLSGLRSAGRATDGMAKSLDVAEGFALWALVKHLRPRLVVELGVQYGISARLWKEALTAYVPGHSLILCDLEDHRRLIGDDEARFYREDAATLLPRLFSSEQVDILHNDAHPYDLIRWSVEEAITHQVPCLTFHDVGRGPRNPFRLESQHLTQAEKTRQRVNWTQYGHWERHVMAELFSPDLLHQDTAQARGWRVQIFDSLFGFGAALRQTDSSRRP